MISRKVYLPKYKGNSDPSEVSWSYEAIFKSVNEVDGIAQRSTYCCNMLKVTSLHTTHIKNHNFYLTWRIET